MQAAPQPLKRDAEVGSTLFLSGRTSACSGLLPLVQVAAFAKMGSELPFAANCTDVRYQPTEA